jgi:hypothetical protein
MPAAESLNVQKTAELVCRAVSRGDRLVRIRSGRASGSAIRGYVQNLFAILETDPVRDRELPTCHLRPILLTPETEGATRRYRATGAFNRTACLPDGPCGAAKLPDRVHLTQRQQDVLRGVNPPQWQSGQPALQVERREFNPFNVSNGYGALRPFQGNVSA